MSLGRVLRTAAKARPAASVSASASASRALRPSLAALARAPRHATAIPCTARRNYASASSTPHGDPGVDPSIAVRDLTDAEYQEAADTTMDLMHENLETMCEEFGPETWEVEYSSGVMTLTLPPHGTYVINKQPPNHQIWVSSPISGPSRFSVGEDGGWVHHRKKGVRLGVLLDEELKGLLAQANAEAEWEGVGFQ